MTTDSYVYDIDIEFNEDENYVIVTVNEFIPKTTSFVMELQVTLPEIADDEYTFDFTFYRNNLCQ